MIKILLASGSPRRTELLQNCGFTVRVKPSGAGEDIGGEKDPEKAAMLLSERKASAVTAESDEYTVAADTSVVIDGKISGKPKDEDDAFAMLKRLSGRTHRVYTGITVIHGGKSVSGCDITEVTFRKTDDGLIKRYITTGEPMDKAGAYGIQKFGSALVERINGDYFNVMGLPLHLLFDILEKDFGVEPLSWLD